MDTQTRNHLPADRAITSADPRPERSLPAIMDPDTGMREAVNGLVRRYDTSAQSARPEDRELRIFYRDVYDHVVRVIDFVETYRDLLTGSLDIYLSAVANRTIVEIETFGAGADAMARLRSDPDVIAVNVEESEQSEIVLVQSERGTEITQRLLSHLDGVRVGRVAVREPTLEDAYVHLIATTGEAAA